LRTALGNRRRLRQIHGLPGLQAEDDALAVRERFAVARLAQLEAAYDREMNRLADCKF